MLSQLLKRKGVAHNVLNAKFHGEEASIVAQAGTPGSVTIATNMAGRGTDILLGGNVDFFASELLKEKGLDPQLATLEQKEQALEKVKAETINDHENVINLGGLHIIGTERHESRRIDNQLRGRAGRQGDPGSNRFYLSLADDLMRIFSADRITKFMNFVQWEEDLPIEHPMISRSIEIAQKRVEGHNFEIRKQLLEYDNVMNKQREIVYEQRHKILEQDNIREFIIELIYEVVDEEVTKHLPPEVHPADWNLTGVEDWMRSKFGIIFKAPDDGDIAEAVAKTLITLYEAKITSMPPEMANSFERSICLHILDTQWKDHLHAMDSLREGIGLRAYGQKDPLVEYQHEAYILFMDMIARIKEETIEFLFKVKTFEQEESPAGVFDSAPMAFSHPESDTFKHSAPTPAETQSSTPFTQSQQDNSEPFTRTEKKVGRNEPCPCGSGKKHKKCCGK